MPARSPVCTFPRVGVSVGMVTSLFPPDIGGIQTHTWKVSEALASQGARVTVVTRHHHGLPRRETKNGVTILRVGRGDATRSIATGTYVVEALAALVRERARIDVLHCQQMLSPLTVGLLGKLLLGVPLVVNPHACGAIGDVAQAGAWRGKLAQRFGDAFVAISQPIRAELEGLGIAPARILDIPNGVDTQVLRPADAAERAALRAAHGLPPGPLAVYVGRLAPEKGPDVLLDAWAQVRARLPAATLLVVGSGALDAALRAQAERLGLASSLRFQGPVPESTPYLRAADAFVLPSRTEGLPVALLEAMSCALPCVATRVGGSVEVLGDGRGWLVPSEDPAALAEGLTQALTAADRDERARRARDVCTSRYGLAGVARAYLDLYGQLLDSKRLQSASAPLA